MSIYHYLHHLLHLLPAELAHDIAIKALSLGLSPKLSSVSEKYNTTNIAGLDFPNPLGIAAGFDKNGQAVQGLYNLGFGFVEIGTVTPRPQRGNPKPRLFRLKSDNAIINRMGFNNAGMDALARNLDKDIQQTGPLGINIGCNKDTESPKDDYQKCAQALACYADYIVVNVSSPNTPGLRKLQAYDQLKQILEATQEGIVQAQVSRPIFVKIAPDLNENDINEILQILSEGYAQGLIITNTTISRPSHLTSSADLINQAGGLSGQPLKDMSAQILHQIRHKIGPDLPIISVGGVATSKEFDSRLSKGADLVQIYTGFIYRGVSLIDEILHHSA